MKFRYFTMPTDRLARHAVVCIVGRHGCHVDSIRLDGRRLIFGPFAETPANDLIAEFLDGFAAAASFIFRHEPELFETKGSDHDSASGSDRPVDRPAP